MYEEEERAKPFEGEFRDFKATLTHRDYNGVQLNPLIVSVDTEIIGKTTFTEIKAVQMVY